MTPERFWQLVDTLDGVADDETCARLDALLRRTGEGPAFAGIVEDLVEPLVQGCRWPELFVGTDIASWVAAAVVASGKATYDVVRAQGEVDPEQWRWDEAEALLVLGFEDPEADRGNGPPADHGEPVPPVAVTLQWLSIPSPAGVRTPDDGDPDMVIDLGDHPRVGRVPVHDPDWVEAQRRLAADQSFVARRLRVGHVGLWLTVRPVPPEGELAPEPSNHSPFDGYRPVLEAAVHHVETHDGPGVVLIVPVSDFSDPESRVDGYVRAVHQLLVAAQG